MSAIVRPVLTRKALAFPFLSSLILLLALACGPAASPVTPEPQKSTGTPVGEGVAETPTRAATPTPPRTSEVMPQRTGDAQATANDSKGASESSGDRTGAGGEEASIPKSDESSGDNQAPPKATPVMQMGDPSEGTSSELEGASPGTVYTYQDGDRTLRVVLEPPKQSQETVADASEDGIAKKGESDSIPLEQSGPDHDQPVFRSESGGELMTLPGGIMVALDPEWDQSAVEEFFSRNGISLDRTSELDFLVNGFFVETEPGFPSLELANALAGQEGVIISSPNWAREVELD